MDKICNCTFKEGLRYFLTFTLLSSFILLQSCGGGGSSRTDRTSQNTQNSTATSGQLSGNVLNATTGQAISGATVSVDGQTASTATDGTYSISNITFAERIIVTVSRAGFADQSKIIRLSNNTNEAALSISLLPVGSSLTFDPATPQTFTIAATPASATLGANTLEQANGDVPAIGNVTVKLTIIDQTVDINLLPGNMLTDVGGGILSPIESFGAFTMTFSDSSVNNLNLIAGASTTIHIPLADKTGTPPASTTLYYYDDTTGLWVAGPTGTLTTDGSGTYYQATVSRFATWMAGSVYPPVLINGCVENSLGLRVSNATVTTIGDDYSGTTTTLTDTNGNFSIIAKQNSSVLVFSSLVGVQSNSALLTTTSSNQTMGACLILPIGEAVTIKLTWGQSPSDLDSHLVGPAGSGIHTYYLSRGSLVNFPFSNLDVDDISSFGPEVITIFDFPQAGTYRYSVHNYSRSVSAGASGITASPARVELNVNGNITLFIPPAGETSSSQTWNVIDFVVNASGGVTVNPVNTWTTVSP